MKVIELFDFSGSGSDLGRIVGYTILGLVHHALIVGTAMAQPRQHPIDVITENRLTVSIQWASEAAGATWLPELYTYGRNAPDSDNRTHVESITVI